MTETCTFSSWDEKNQKFTACGRPAIAPDTTDSPSPVPLCGQHVARLYVPADAEPAETVEEQDA